MNAANLTPDTLSALADEADALADHARTVAGHLRGESLSDEQMAQGDETEARR